MTEETIKIGTEQTVEIGELSFTGKVEVGQGTNKTIGKEILEATQGHIKILEDRIVEENIEVIIGMRITVEREVKVGLEKDHFQGIIRIEGMVEAQITAAQDQDPEQVQIGTESGAESMITLQKIVLCPRKRKK